MLTAYIMAGGSGERFWPLSTPEKPKQLLSLFSDYSMIRETVERILPIIPAERIFVGTNIKQAPGIIAELPMLPEENVVVEPAFKDTAAAIGYGALYVSKYVENPCMLVLPSDHLIEDPEGFRNTVVNASREAVDHGSIVTLGIKPRNPEVAYGYIRVEENCSLGTVYDAEQFLEKPNLENAKIYVAAGNFLWNSGMFIFETQTILGEIERLMPEHYATLSKINEKIKEGLQKVELSEATRAFFDEFERVSIDFGVMEKTDRIKVIPSEFGWNDIGSFNAFEDVFDGDDAGNIVRHSKAACINSNNNIIITEDKEVGVIGLDNIVVVQTKDKLLVCDRNQLHDIKKVVQTLK